MLIEQLANGRIRIGELTITPNKDLKEVTDNGDTDTIEIYYAGARVHWFLFSQVTGTQLHGGLLTMPPATRALLCDLLNASFFTS